MKFCEETKQLLLDVREEIRIQHESDKDDCDMCEEFKKGGEPCPMWPLLVRLDAALGGAS